MSGTKIGGKRAAKANKLNHGKNFYKKIGKLGGKKGKADGTIKGWGLNPEKARLSGMLGGTIGRRGNTSLPVDEEKAAEIRLKIKQLPKVALSDDYFTLDTNYEQV